MGACCSSKTVEAKQFIFDDTIPGHGFYCRNTFNDICLRQTEVDMFYELFCELDDKNTKFVKFQSIYQKYELIISSKAFSRIFEVFDKEKSGRMDFMEFVCVVWNFLTMDSKEMGGFTLLVNTNHEKKRLIVADLEHLIEEIHGKQQLHQNSILVSFIDKIRCYGIDIDRRDFLDIASEHSVWVAPIMRIQFDLRNKLLGKPFWDSLTLKRAENANQCRADYILGFRDALAASRNSYPTTQREETIPTTTQTTNHENSETPTPANIKAMEKKKLTQEADKQLQTYFGIAKPKSQREARGYFNTKYDLTTGDAKEIQYSEMVLPNYMNEKLAKKVTPHQSPANSLHKVVQPPPPLQIKTIQVHSATGTPHGHESSSSPSSNITIKSVPQNIISGTATPNHSPRVKGSLKGGQGGHLLQPSSLPNSPAGSPRGLIQRPHHYHTVSNNIQNKDDVSWRSGGGDRKITPQARPRKKS